MGQAQGKRRVGQTQERKLLAVTIVALLAGAAAMAAYQWSVNGSGPVVIASGAAMQQERNNLAAMRTSQLQLNNNTVHVWLALTDKQRELGLMWVRPHEMADNQGMLFVFDDDQDGGFWMKNTLIPLDIAFIRHDGLVIDTKEMVPLSHLSHGPPASYRYALEVKAGVLKKLGVRPGHRIAIPSDVLNLPATRAERTNGSETAAD